MSLPFPIPTYINPLFRAENENNAGDTIYAGGKIFSAKWPLTIGGLHTPVKALTVDFNGLLRNTVIDWGDGAANTTLTLANAARNNNDGTDPPQTNLVYRWPTAVWYQIGVMHPTDKTKSQLFPRLSFWATSTVTRASQIKNTFMVDTDTFPFMRGMTRNPYVNVGGEGMLDDVTDGTWDMVPLALDGTNTVTISTTGNNTVSTLFTSFRLLDSWTLHIPPEINALSNPELASYSGFFRIMLDFSPCWIPNSSLTAAQQAAHSATIFNHRHVVNLNVLVNVHQGIDAVVERRPH